MKKLSAVFCMVVMALLLLAMPVPSFAADSEASETNLTLQQALDGTSLTEEEKKWLKEKEKEAMKQAAEMITSGMEDEVDGKKNKLKIAAQYMIKDVKDWSAFAGKLRAGDSRDAVNLLATAGGSVVNEIIEDRLPDGNAKDAYKFIIENADDAKEIARVLLNSTKSWSDVNEVIWDRLQAAAKKKLEDNADKLVTSVINYAFGDGSFLGYTPGDAYLLVLKTEMQVIEVWNQKYDMRRQNELYAQYKEARDRGDTHGAAWEAVSVELVRARYAKAFGYTTSEGEVANMFGVLYGQDKDARDFGWWLRNKLKEKVEEERKKLDLESALKSARTELQRGVNDFLKRMWRTAEGLMERNMSDLMKKKRADAIAKAKQLLGILTRAAAEISAHCKTYEASHGRLVKLFAELEATKKEIAAFPALLSDARRSRTYIQDAKALSDWVTGVEKFFGEFEQSRDRAGTAATDCCGYSEQISRATGKDQASKLMNQSVAEARKASKEITEATNKGTHLKTAQADFARAVSAVSSKYGRDDVEAMRQSLDKIRTFLAKLNPAEEARMQQEFKSAIAAMGPAATKGESLMVYGKGVQNQVKAALQYFTPNQEMNDIITKADAALADGVCATINYANWSGGTDRWSTRQVPTLPKADESLLSEARALLASANAASSASSPAECVKRMGEIREKLDTGLYELDLAKRAYERCVEEAVLAYNARWLSKVRIAGPTTASPGQKITLQATIADPGTARYGYRWSGDGKELGSITSVQEVTASALGDHVIRVAVWRWSPETNGWQQDGEASHNLRVTAARVEIAGPDRAKPREKVTYSASLVPPTQDRLGFTWLLDGRLVGQSSTTGTQAVDFPDGQGRHTVTAKVSRWVNNAWQPAGEGTRTVDVTAPVASRVVASAREGPTPVSVQVTLSPGGAVRSGAEVVFENVPSGSIRLVARASGYMDETCGLNHDAGDPNGSRCFFSMKRVGRMSTGGYR